MAGTVVEVLANSKITHQIEGGYYVLAHISGKMRERYNCII